MAKHHRRKGAKRKKVAAAKVRHGHCENPTCGERESLRLIVVQVDGKKAGKTKKFCRSCTYMLLARIDGA